MGQVRLPLRMPRLNVESAFSDFFDFNTPEENDLLFEGPLATNVVAASKPREEVIIISHQQ